ncbi:MAG: hypothetical protein KDI68_02865 [Gammaproteobacteria bacterium]|nr:hypothetical protein [Gammaproteobacteria bacterium]
MRRLLLLPLLLSVLTAGAQEPPEVWGFGVKPCRDYLATFERWQQGEEAAIADYLRYRGWLAGLVTGLSLATGQGVLKGVEMDGAMRRIQVNCDERPDDDFFNASMSLIRRLSGLGG